MSTSGHEHLGDDQHGQGTHQAETPEEAQQRPVAELEVPTLRTCLSP